MTGSSLWYLNIKSVLAVNTCLCDNHEFSCVIILYHHYPKIRTMRAEMDARLLTIWDCQVYDNFAQR